MYKEVLRTIAGIEVFPLLSLGVFLTVFLVMLVWVVRLEAGRLSRYAHLPFDDETGEACAVTPEAGATRPEGRS